MNHAAYTANHKTSKYNLGGTTNTVQFICIL
jgi:hypothetical protein